MIKRLDEFAEKNKKDALITENAFTLAVNKASDGGGKLIDEKGILTKTPENSGNDSAMSELKAKDELMRAKEARNETTSESSKFRRDEN